MGAMEHAMTRQAGLSPDAIERQLVAAGVPRDKARASSLEFRPAIVKPGEATSPISNIVVGPLDSPIRAVRWLDGMRCTIAAPPRTKKNGGAGGFMGIKQRPAYRRYRDTIVNGFEPLLDGCRLPLELREYTLRATFYVDKAGERADLVGLLQGLADALENAKVVSDDWWFRSFDGSRVVAGDPRPRVELLIAPLDA